MDVLKNPLLKWAGWAVILVTIFIFFMRGFFLAGLEKDASGISWVIIAFFAIGTGLSFLEAAKLARDQHHLNQLVRNGLEGLEHLDGRVPRLLKKIQVLYAKNQPVDTGVIIDSFDTYHGASVRSLAVTSTVLVTFGLIGTMIGLISSISGLNELVSSIGTSQTELMKGMQKTINGMGVAFYTTFFGAFFGGILLKILAASLSGSLSRVSASLQNFIALELNPSTLPDMMSSLNREVAALAETWKAMSENMAESGKQLEENLARFNRTVQTADLQLQNLSGTMLKSDASQQNSRLDK